jgi:hypothetical protein
LDGIVSTWMHLESLCERCARQPHRLVRQRQLNVVFDGFHRRVLIKDGTQT